MLSNNVHIHTLIIFHIIDKNVHRITGCICLHDIRNWYNPFIPSDIKLIHSESCNIEFVEN